MIIKYKPDWDELGSTALQPGGSLYEAKRGKIRRGDMIRVENFNDYVKPSSHTLGTMGDLMKEAIGRNPEISDHFLVKSVTNNKLIITPSNHNFQLEVLGEDGAGNRDTFIEECSVDADGNLHIIAMNPYSYGGDPQNFVVFIEIEDSAGDVVTSEVDSGEWTWNADADAYYQLLSWDYDNGSQYYMTVDSLDVPPVVSSNDTYTLYLSFQLTNSSQGHHYDSDIIEYTIEDSTPIDPSEWVVKLEAYHNGSSYIIINDGAIALDNGDYIGSHTFDFDDTVMSELQNLSSIIRQSDGNPSTEPSASMSIVASIVNVDGIDGDSDTLNLKSGIEVTAPDMGDEASNDDNIDVTLTQHSTDSISDGDNYKIAIVNSTTYNEYTHTNYDSLSWTGTDDSNGYKTVSVDLSSLTWATTNLVTGDYTVKVYKTIDGEEYTFGNSGLFNIEATYDSLTVTLSAPDVYLGGSVTVNWEAEDLT